MARDSAYIDDEVAGLIKCLDSNVNYDIINIGTGNPVTVLELADTIISSFGKGGKVHIDKSPTEVQMMPDWYKKMEETI